jgi:hypothetical protein
MMKKINDDCVYNGVKHSRHSWPEEDEYYLTRWCSNCGKRQHAVWVDDDEKDNITSDIQ